MLALIVWKFSNFFLNIIIIIWWLSHQNLWRRRSSQNVTKNEIFLLALSSEKSCMSLDHHHLLDMPFHLLLLSPKDDGLLRWEKRMTSVCGHLHLSSSYPEIYDCSHTTVIISSSGVISQAAKWSWVATYVNTAKLVFFTAQV